MIKYDYVGAYYDKLAFVKYDNKWGFIDENQNEIIPCIYDYVNNFINGLSIITLNGKTGIINKNADIIYDFICDNIFYYNELYFIIYIDANYGIINRLGDVIIKCEYTIVEVGILMNKYILNQNRISKLKNII